MLDSSFKGWMTCSAVRMTPTCEPEPDLPPEEIADGTLVQCDPRDDAKSDCCPKPD